MALSNPLISDAGTGNHWTTGNDPLAGYFNEIYNNANYSVDGLAGYDIAFVNTNLTSISISVDSAGVVTLTGASNYSVVTNVEQFDFNGGTHLYVGSTATNDTITGGANNDQLYGLAGNDILNGGTGADKMYGGTGNDIYTVDNVGDVVSEAGATSAAEGVDTVNASITYTLTTNVEKLTLTGTGAINGTGNTGNNIMTGNSGANTLTGLTGNDTLNGGTGADTMIGGAGNDIYIVDNVGDVVTENTGEGTDLVKSSITYTLGTNVEKLTLIGAGAINGTGNTGNNIVVGNTGANTLTGLAGNDTLKGGGGIDTLIGGTGKDVIFGGAGNDTFDFDAINESAATAARDVIKDFTTGDKIDLSTIDANTGSAGDQAFTLTTGTAFSGSFTLAGELYYDTTAHVLYGNNDADATADFSIQVNLSGGLTNLASTDFVL